MSHTSPIRHPHPVKPSRRNIRGLAPLAMVLFAIAALVAVSFVTLTSQTTPPTVTVTATLTTTTQAQAQATPGDETQPSIEYVTEAGQGSQQGVVNSPLQITVRISQPASKQDSNVSINVTLQLLDEAGQPAIYGGIPAGPATMSPAFEPGAWVCYASMPGKPGTYHAHIVMQTQRMSLDTPAAHANQQYDFDLTGTPLQAVAESGPPLISGYVFSENSNLWLMSTDLKRRRRLTFFTPPEEYASQPTWSPDGKQIAFTFSPKTAPSELPLTDIRSVNPDGSGEHELVKHGNGETLKDPAWSSDGRYLYFTAEQSDPNTQTFNSLGVPQSGLEVDRLDVQTGARSHWLDGGEMPGTGSSANRMLFVQDIYDASTNPTNPTNPTFSGQQLVSANADGSGKTVLVNDKAFIAITYPTISPDGKWVAYSAIYLPRTGGQSDHDLFDLLGWLGLEPQPALAHGLPWDMFVVASKGGTPLKISQSSDDQPHPAWLDASTLTYMGTYGMYRVQIGGDGTPLQAPEEIHQGVSHGGLTWHTP